MRRRRQAKGVEVKDRRWKVVALLAAGIAIGIVMLGTPAGAHVAGWTHNWNDGSVGDARHMGSDGALGRPATLTGEISRGSFVRSKYDSSREEGMLKVSRKMVVLFATASPPGH
jgi:hypothetical protein